MKEVVSTSETSISFRATFQKTTNHLYTRRHENLKSQDDKCKQECGFKTRREETIWGKMSEE
jgi:hypothetical protein